LNFRDRCRLFWNLVLLLIGSAVFAQETALEFFNSVSEHYKSISDYSVDIVIEKGDTVQSAKVWYKQPNKLRLDFASPQGMVMTVDGNLLQVWVPAYQTFFTQPLRGNSQAQLANVSSSNGLELIKKYYTISYDPGPELMSLEPDSSIKVVKLKAEWKSSTQGFRRLDLSIDTDRQIRKIVGITTINEEITFIFSNFSLNQGISDSKFQFEAPSTGNVIENFLFDPS